MFSAPLKLTKINPVACLQVRGKSIARTFAPGMNQGRIMGLTLIRDGQADAAVEKGNGAPGAFQVGQEAIRRLRQAGYTQQHMRRLVSGGSIPKPLEYYRMQVEFVARKLAALDPVPEDYASDIYWPAP